MSIDRDSFSGRDDRLALNRGLRTAGKYIGLYRGRMNALYELDRLPPTQDQQYAMAGLMSIIILHRIRVEVRYEFKDKGSKDHG